MTASQPERAVDQLIGQLALGPDPVLDAVLAANAGAGLAPIDVARNQGKLLEILVRGARARRVLEIGTLGGYSTICLARGVGAGGAVVTIERDERAAAVAVRNLGAAGLADRVQVRVGAALDVLPALAEAGGPPFDFAFIDADKPSYDAYYEACLKLVRVGGIIAFIDADKQNNVAYVERAARLCRPGALVLVDNVIRAGRILDPEAAAAAGDLGARGSRDLLEHIGTSDRIDGTAIQTVGEKGWDGFALLIVAGDPP